MQLFLTLLRIIGILILAVILLVLLVLLLVLFCPVRYKVLISRTLDKSPEAKIRITWLLHLLSLRVDYREKMSYCLKVLGITVLKDDDVLALKDKKAEEKQKTDSGESSSGQVPSGENDSGEKSEQPDSQAKIKASSQEPDPRHRPDPVQKPEENATEAQANPGQNKEKVPLIKRIGDFLDRIAEFLSGLQEKIPEKITDFFEEFAEVLEKISEWPDTILEKIDNVQRKKDKLLKQLKDEQNQAAVKTIFGSLGALLKHIRPQKLKAVGRLGFDDPAATGQIFGVIGMLMPLYGDNIHLEAVFDEAVVEGQIEIKGHVRAGTVIGLALKLVFKKEVRRLITQVKRLKKA